MKRTGKIFFVEVKYIEHENENLWTIMINMKKTMSRVVASIMLMGMISIIAKPTAECPSLLSSSGVVNDLGMLADVVSSDQADIVKGVCGTYEQMYEKNGAYDTRMRIYQNLDTNHTVFTFRPTQQTREGGDIHNDRKLSACRYMNGSCYGLVNDRFQEAFSTLIEDLDDEFFKTLRTLNVSTVGHSLGGSFQLMMGVYLNSMFNITPVYMLGLAGPFVGDEVFTTTYQSPLKDVMKDRWWQIETVDKTDPRSYDGTVEGYNVNNGDGVPDWGNLPFNPLSPFQPWVPKEDRIKTPIFIDRDALCGVLIEPLAESYGMHDLKNYRLALTGRQCEGEGNDA